MARNDYFVSTCMVLFSWEIKNSCFSATWSDHSRWNYYRKIMEDKIYVLKLGKYLYGGEKQTGNNIVSTLTDVLCECPVCVKNAVLALGKEMQLQ